jgi:hypothetical protein
VLLVIDAFGDIGRQPQPDNEQGGQYPQDPAPHFRFVLAARPTPGL